MDRDRIEINGRRVAFVRHGTGAPIVLLHGVGLRAEAWAPQIASLVHRHCVIALDLPGHGGSDLLHGDGALNDYVDWCAQVLTALQIGPVSLAGHSMGALIALGVAATRADAVTRVALLNGVYCRDAKARAAVEDRANAIAQGIFDLETPLRRWFGDTEIEQLARAQVADWLSRVSQDGYAMAYRAFAQGDRVYANALARIACPFLALTGAEDPNSTPHMAQAMAQQAQDGAAVVIEGHRHMVNLTAPNQVTEALQTWLARSARTRVKEEK